MPNTMLDPQKLNSLLNELQEESEVIDLPPRTVIGAVRRAARHGRLDAETPEQ